MATLRNEDGAITLVESESTRGFDVYNFELVQATKQPLVGLTAQDTFKALVDGTDVQYSTNGGSTWHDVTYPEKLTVLAITQHTYRNKPTEVSLCGSVAYPIQSRDATRAYSVNFSTGKISEYFSVYLPDAGVYWDTKEQAEHFRDTVLASLKV